MSVVVRPLGRDDALAFLGLIDGLAAASGRGIVVQRPPSAQTECLGVAETQLAVLRLGWVAREQPVEDSGIDAHVEVVADGLATASL